MKEINKKKSSEETTPEERKQGISQAQEAIVESISTLNPDTIFYIGWNTSKEDERGGYSTCVMIGKTSDIINMLLSLTEDDPDLDEILFEVVKERVSKKVLARVFSEKE